MMNVTMTGDLKRVYDAMPHPRTMVRRAEYIACEAKVSTSTVLYFGRALRDLGLVSIVRQGRTQYFVKRRGA